MIFGKTEEATENCFGFKANDDMVTALTYFNEAKRQSSKDAGLDELTTALWPAASTSRVREPPSWSSIWVGMLSMPPSLVLKRTS